MTKSQCSEEPDRNVSGSKQNVNAITPLQKPSQDIGGNIISHISFGVSNLSRSIAFYDATLAPLDIVRVWTVSDAAGYGLLAEMINLPLSYRQSL